jgi:hypothetical protein
MRNMYDWDCGLDFADNQDYHHWCVDAHLDHTGNVSRAAEEPYAFEFCVFSVRRHHALKESKMVLVGRLYCNVDQVKYRI